MKNMTEKKSDTLQGHLVNSIIYLLKLAIFRAENPWE